MCVLKNFLIMYPYKKKKKNSLIFKDLLIYRNSIFKKSKVLYIKADIYFLFFFFLQGF